VHILHEDLGTFKISRRYWPIDKTDRQTDMRCYDWL